MLRDLDLTKRLFKYPCSYMIYSEAFDNMPEVARDRIYRRLWEVLLAGDDKSPKFARLSTDDRKAIIEILRENQKKVCPRTGRLRKLGYCGTGRPIDL